MRWQGGLDQAPKSQEITNVHTVIADKYKWFVSPTPSRSRSLPTPTRGETITLTPVKANKAKPRFPRGSLLKHFTGDAGRERDKLETAIASGCLQGPPE